MLVEWTPSTPVAEIAALRSQREAHWFASAERGEPHWIYALHLHKAAGTELCNLAKRSGEIVPHAELYYCMPPVEAQGPQQRPRWIKHLPFHLVNGTLRTASFFMVEWSGFTRPVLLSGLPLLYITAFRHPVDRIVSNWQMDVRLKWAPRNMTLTQYALGDMYSLYLTDNYEVRHLAGGGREGLGGYIAPATWPTALAAALSRLNVFSVILILEEWDLTVKLLCRFGWPDYRLSAGQARQAKLSWTGRRLYLRQSDPVLWARLCEKNKWALALYADAHMRALERERELCRGEADCVPRPPVTLSPSRNHREGLWLRHSTQNLRV
jgi:hypothetical protein